MLRRLHQLSQRGSASYLLNDTNVPAMEILFISAVETNRRQAQTCLLPLGQVQLADSFAAGLKKMRTQEFAIVVIDLVAPVFDLAEFLEALREISLSVRVLVITLAQMAMERICAVEKGADDDLIRPFTPAELIARVRALGKQVAPHATLVRAGDIEIDSRRGTVTRAGRAVFLTAREFRLLEFFARRRGEIVTQIDLELGVYGPQQELRSNAIESAICSLRKKLNGSGEANLILTRRGFGYLLNA